MDARPADILKRLIMLLAGAAVVFCAIATYGDSIRLHDQAAVHARRVTLADVAELSGPTAEALGDTVVATLRDSQQGAGVTIETIRRTLDEKDVNWSDLSLRGYAACRITVLPDEPAAPQVDDSAAVAGNPQEEVNLTSTMTLRDLIVQKVESVAGSPAGELRITFDPRDDERLAAAVFGQRYEVVPHKERGLGRLLMRVRRYEIDQLAEQFTITVDVARRTLAAVATRSISRGEPFLDSAFEVREVYLTDTATQPVPDPKLLIGQTAARLLREGSVITLDDVRSPVMIRRGELVNVRCISGNLVIRLDARAMEDGALDESIRLRNERSREDFAATVTGLRQAAFSVTPAIVQTPETPQAAAP